MPDCGGTSCNCQLEVGPGLELTGSGALGNPFRIALSGDIQDSLTVEDTITVDLVLNGGGSPADPYRLKAEAHLRVQDLTDVVDPEGAPNAGDTLVWITSGVETPRFEFRPPPANPAGSVNVGAGIDGIGSLGDPIRVSVIGTTAGGATTGLEVYVDSAGNLRAVPPVATGVTWASISGKPSTFATTPADFTGTLPVSKGGTGQTDLAAVTVGNATKVGGIRIYVQSSAPVGAAVNDLWFWGA